MKTVEWSVLTAMSAGLAVVVFLFVAPAASGLAGKIGVRECAAGAWTPEVLRCGLEPALR